MDCNKDEAIKAKAIAEEKFSANDIVGAKKFALKAQALFPALEGISQLIVVLDVYLASQVKVGGEKDLYGILCLNASADEETMKKQYKKMALQLHPDKNRSVGAEGAFKLISEAWSTLSDKMLRMEYDQKIISEQSQKKVYQTNRESSVPKDDGTRTYNFTHDMAWKPRAPTPTNTTPRADTFWTSCDNCGMQYEYFLMYINQKLVCANCHESFWAKDIGGPIHGLGSAVPWPIQSDHSSSKSNWVFTNISAPNDQPGDNIGMFGNQNMQWGGFASTAGADTATSAAAQAANLFQEAYEEAKREQEEAKRKRKFSAPEENINARSTESSATKKSRASEMGKMDEVSEQENLKMESEHDGFGFDKKQYATAKDQTIDQNADLGIDMNETMSTVPNAHAHNFDNDCPESPFEYDHIKFL